MDKDQWKKLSDALTSKGIRKECPACGNTDPAVFVDGFVLHGIQQEKATIEPVKQALPTVGTICRNCGLVSFYALGALEKLPDTEEAK